jgi:uncharacterized membrane protein
MIARVDRLAVAGALVAIAGLGIAVYLTIAHYAHAPLACVTTGPIDCAAVTSSSYSLVPGTDVPITLVGIAFFVLSGTFFALAAGGAEPAWLPSLHFGIAALALLAVLYLVYAEIVVINRVCEWCTLVHVLVLATFLITLRRVQTALAAV